MVQDNLLVRGHFAFIAKFGLVRGRVTLAKLAMCQHVSPLPVPPPATDFLLQDACVRKLPPFLVVACVRFEVWTVFPEELVYKLCMMVLLEQVSGVSPFLTGIVIAKPESNHSGFALLTKGWLCCVTNYSVLFIKQARIAVQQIHS